jgi:hypothetical protein
MKASILHAPDGQIIAITMEHQAHAAPGQLHRAPMLPRPGQHLLHLDLTEDQAQKPLLELYKHHQVDLANRRLIRKPSAS